MVVDQGAPAWPVFKIAPHAHSYPFGYSEAEQSALGELLIPEYEDETGQVQRWARSIVAGEPTATLSLLQDLDNAVRNLAVYAKRDNEGMQPPTETPPSEGTLYSAIFMQSEMTIFNWKN
jgi:hypothetical protein